METGLRSGMAVKLPKQRVGVEARLNEDSALGIGEFFVAAVVVRAVCGFVIRCGPANSG